MSPTSRGQLTSAVDAGRDMATTVETGVYCPTSDEWDTVDPTEAGFNPERLAAAVQFSLDHVRQNHTAAAVQFTTMLP